jgi:peptide/nickel transport system substrate-binding protein
MARRFNVAVAATAAVALGLTGCSSPSSKNGDANGNGGDTGKITTQENAFDPAAKGPAKDVPGARKGGTLTVVAQTTPNTFDPTDIYYTDSNEIGKLLFRTPTQFDIRNGKPTLVPDLTDLGTASADKLTWTFKMQPGIKYENGTSSSTSRTATSTRARTRAATTTPAWRRRAPTP